MGSLLQTKLTAPALRQLLVRRNRLFKRLGDVHHMKLVLVSAPAGYGKTTLITAFDKQETSRGKKSFSWLSLSEADNDPARFLAYFLAALKTAGLELSLNETAVFTLPPDMFMTDVVNSITESLSPQTHLIFVLDDYHLIQNRVIHEAITFLLEHMPAQMHLILTTRADPPLPLARWRARSQLLELRQQDLRFTPEEAADFLNQVMALSLTAADVETLNRRTEGWIAGLQMAAVSLQNRPDTTNFVQNFSGSHRYILDYLMEEVLSRQPEEVVHFLLQTAVLERLCAPLCDAISEASDGLVETNHAQTILEKLDTANLFILPLDQERQWYRYHRLFADLLRQRLVQTKPALVPLLHQRAAVWFETNGYPEEAIAHALLAEAYEHAARLIEQTAEAMLMRSEQVTFMRWVAALPEAELAKRPSLSLYYAYTLILEGHAPAEIENVLQPVKIEDSPGELALVRSLLAIYLGDGATSIDLAQQALTHLDASRTFLRGMATWVLGIAYIFYGDLDRGWQALEQAVQLSQQVGNMTIAVSSWGRMANQVWRKGELHQAKRIYEQALILAKDEAERPLPIAGEPHIGLARIYFEWNDLPAALEHAEIGLTLSERWREISGMAGIIWLARIKQAMGEPEVANKSLERARQIAIKSEGTQFDDMAVDMTEAHLNLLQGNLKAVALWCDSRQIPDEIDLNALKMRDDIIDGHLRKYEFIILARLRVAQKQPEAALALLLPLQTDAQRLQRRDLQIEIQILAAIAYQQLNQLAQADFHMQKALSLGEPGGFIRIFVDAGADVAEILKRQKAEGGRMKAYLQTLLAACGQIPEQSLTSTPLASSGQGLPSPLVEPLSKRELEILTLIASGLSNREIAEELVLSLPTIKWHTSNIYGKLGVRNRTTAVAHARDLEILPKT